MNRCACSLVSLLLALTLAPILTPKGRPAADQFVSTNAPDASERHVSLIGQLGGAMYATTVQGSRLYLGEGGRLDIMDISDLDAPVLIGKTPLMHGLVRAVAMAGETAYVAAASAGLRVVDVSDPAQPVEIASYDISEDANDVAVAGSYAYIADYQAGLRILDVSNPAQPIEVGFYDTPGWTYGLVVVGSYAYIADYQAGLRILDVSNPAQPIEVGFYDTHNYTYDVAVVGDYAYVASYGLSVVDVSDPAHPVQAAFMYTAGEAQHLAVVGSTVYLADDYGGLRVVDVSDPAHPVEMGFYDTPGYANDVAVAEGIAYVADRLAGLRVVDVTDPTRPFETDHYGTLGDACDMAVVGEYAYVADSQAGLRVVNVSDSAHPVEVGFYDTPGSADDVAVAGGYAYVAEGASGGLRIVDVSDPLHPSEIGFYDSPEGAVRVAVAGQYVYLAGEYTLLVVDASDPTHLFEVGRWIGAPESIHGIAVVGAYAYLGVGDAGLYVVNVSDPAHPFDVGYYNMPGWVGNLMVMGDYAYMAADDGLYVVDVSSPTDPVEVGFYGTRGRAWDVAVAERLAYVADDYGLEVIDVSNPVNPFEVGFYDTPGSASGVVADGTNVYVAGGSAGFLILRYAPVQFVKLLFVPLNWHSTQAAFDVEAQLQSADFFNQVPLNACPERYMVETLRVTTQNFTDFTCSEDSKALLSIRNFVEQKGIDPAYYTTVIGLAETSPCPPANGQSNKVDTVWVTSVYDISVSHELGHVYGLSDQYCSNRAGSTDQRCNDGDIQGDGAVSGDVNWLDAGLPFDCPPDGSNDSSGSPCCNYGGNECSVVNYGACCLGNKNGNGNGRSTMSSALAPSPRGYDAHELAYLSSQFALTCDPVATGLETTGNARSLYLPQVIVGVSLSVHQDDTVDDAGTSITMGLPTDQSVLENFAGDYTLAVTDAESRTLWSQAFPLYFDYEGLVVAGVDYSGILYDTADVSFRIPHTCGMSMVELYHNGELIFSKALPPVCPVYLPLVFRRY